MNNNLASAPAVSITRQDFASAHLLKVREHALQAAPPAGTGLAIPSANRACGENPRVLWMGPGEYLLIGAGEAALALLDFPGTWHFAEVTHGLASFVVGGRLATDVLVKGCTLDLHPDVFGADHCTRTRFAQVRVLVERISPEAFRLTVDASLADYLQAWLDDAALEFQQVSETR